MRRLEKIPLIWACFSPVACPAVVHFYCRDVLKNVWLRMPMGLKDHWSEGGKEEVADFQPEIVEALEWVYRTYEDVLEKARKDPAFIKSFIAELRAEDASEASKNVRYVVYRNKETRQIEGVGRVIVLRDGEVGTLPVLVGTPFEHVTGNRVEVGRLAGISVPGRTPVTKEMANAVATYLHSVFPDNDYVIYVGTDAPRARLYRTTYNLEVAHKSRNAESPSSYLLTIDGKKFFDIYAGHIQTAYELALRDGKWEEAHELLEMYRDQYHLQDFQPNQNAMAHVELVYRAIVGGGVPRNRWELVASRPEKSLENLDFEVIFRIRATYDLRTTRGDAAEALRLLDEYVASNPIDKTRDRRRWLLLRCYRAVYRTHLGHFEEMRYYRSFQAPDVPLADRTRFEEVIAGWESAWGKKLGRATLGEPSLLVAVDRLLEPSKATFLEFTSPHLHYLKGLILEARGDARGARHFLNMGRGLVAPTDLPAFDEYWEAKRRDLF